jgi:hypothetical protein
VNHRGASMKATRSIAIPIAGGNFLRYACFDDALQPAQ